MKEFSIEFSNEKRKELAAEFNNFARWFNPREIQERIRIFRNAPTQGTMHTEQDKIGVQEEVLAYTSFANFIKDHGPVYQELADIIAEKKTLSALTSEELDRFRLVKKILVDEYHIPEWILMGTRKDS